MTEHWQIRRIGQPCGIIRAAALWTLCRYRHNVHWAGHSSRLNRDLGGQRWGDAGYAMEELVAEIGSAFVCAELGLIPDIRDDHAPYIAEWLRVLADDNKAIFTAAGHAQKAADFLRARADARAAEEPEWRAA
jgi:antirestriction protein ArdC